MAAAVLSPRARRDVLEAVRWIAEDNPVAAEGLKNAVVAAARQLGSHPATGVIRADLADPSIRFLSLTGYPYIVVYDAAESPPLILRVLHDRRDFPELLRGL